MLNMKKWLVNNRLTIIGAILGAIGGFLYYYFIGCASGTCAITSSPINSTLYFAVLGALLVSILKPSPKKDAKENNSL